MGRETSAVTVTMVNNMAQKMGRVGNAMRISSNEHRPSLDRSQVQGALTSCTGHRGSGTDEIGS